MSRINYNTNQLVLMQKVEKLKYQLLQYQTLLGVCPFNKEELKGDPGPPGERGVDGNITFEEFTPEQLELLRGPQGLQGPQGEQGIKGDAGEQGIQGIKGDKGDKGDPGEQGLKGDKGEKGNDGYTPVKGVDYFDGDKGDKGEKGDKGDKGDSFKYSDFTPEQINGLKPISTFNFQMVNGELIVQDGTGFQVDLVNGELIIN